MDYSKPIFLVLPALFSLFVCDVFFFKLPVFVILNSIFVLASFLVATVLLSNAIGVGKDLRKDDVLKMLPGYSSLKHAVFFLIVISYIPSLMLVYIFSSKFGFISIFTNSSLLQTNAISNSLGNFLYLNVVLIPVLLVMTRYAKWYFLLIFASLFFLYFTGIKSYLIQSVALCFLYALMGRSFSQVFLFLILFFVFVVGFFYYYDSNIDLAASNVEESLGRLLAYFSGSWATFSFYLEEGVYFQYPLISIFYPFYKIISFGSIELNDYLRFYNVNGYELNVVPVFQWVYLEGGVVMQIFSAIFFAYCYCLLRTVAINTKNIFHLLAFLFFCTTFVVSTLFANVFSDLPVYISLLLLLFLGFFSKSKRVIGEE